MELKDKQGTEEDVNKKKENPEKTELDFEFVESVEKSKMELDDKINFLLTKGGLKPASIIELPIRLQTQEEVKEFFKEKEIDEIIELVKKSGLECHIGEKRIAEGSYRTKDEPEIERHSKGEHRDIFIASSKEKLDALMNSWYTEDQEAIGKALGFPPTAVEAFVGKRETWFDENIPNEIRESAAVTFLTPTLSKDNWQEEMKEGDKRARFIKRNSPKIYAEIMTREALDRKQGGIQVEAENAIEAEEKLLEVSKKVGVLWRSVADSLIGKKEFDQVLLDNLPEKVKHKFSRIIDSIKTNKAMQHLQFSLKEFNANKLLSQNNKAEDVENILTLGNYELREISQGIFALYLDESTFKDIAGSVEAKAISIKNGLSYILMQKKYAKTKLEEKNLKHESSHLVWSFLLKDGIINITEENDEMWNAYRFFQDEVIAKIQGGEGPIGYSHLLLSKDLSLDKELLEEINKNVQDANFLLRDDIFPFLGDAGLENESLIFPIMESHNFTELKNNLNKFKKAMVDRIEKMPKKEDVDSGWGLL